MHRYTVGRIANWQRLNPGASRGVRFFTESLPYTRGNCAFVCPRITDWTGDTNRSIFACLIEPRHDKTNKMSVRPAKTTKYDPSSFL